MEEHTNCPPECQLKLDENEESIQKLSDMIFKDSEGGLRFDIRRIKEAMVTKTHVWIALVVIGIPLFVIGARVWSFAEQADLKYQTTAVLS